MGGKYRRTAEANREHDAACLLCPFFHALRCWMLAPVFSYLLGVLYASLVTVGSPPKAEDSLACVDLLSLSLALAVRVIWYSLCLSLAQSCTA